MEDREKLKKSANGTAAVHSNGSIFFAPGEQANRAQLQFYIHSFEDDQSSSVELTNELMQTHFPHSKYTEEDLVIYFPLCTDSALSKNPEHFKQEISDILNKIKGRKVHFLIGNTGSLSRHDLAKQKLMKNPNEDEINFSTDPDSPKFKSCTEANEAWREQGKKTGSTVIKNLNLPSLAEALGCKFSVLEWDAVSDSTTLREKLTSITKPTTTKNPPLGNLSLTLGELALYVQHRYQKNSEFKKALSIKLLEECSKDKKAFGEAYDFDLSSKMNLHYLFEEIAHMMLVRATASDLIQVMMQPQQLTKRRSTPCKRSLFFGEILNEWVQKLLTGFLEEKKFTQDLPQYQYITVGSFSNYHEPKAVRFKTPTPERTPEAVSPKPSHTPPEENGEEKSFLEKTLEEYHRSGGTKGLRTSGDFKLAGAALTLELENLKKAEEQRKLQEKQGQFIEPTTKVNTVSL